MKRTKELTEALYAAQGDLEKEIDLVIELTETRFADNRFDLVDEFLMNVDVCRLGPLTIEGILRSTYRFQRVLPNWEYFLNESRTVLENMGQDMELLLSGLETHAASA